MENKLWRLSPAEADIHAEESDIMYKRALIAKKRAEAFLAEGDKKSASMLCTHGWLNQEILSEIDYSDLNYEQCKNCGSVLDGEPASLGGSGKVIEPCAVEGEWSPLYLKNYSLKREEK